MGGDTQQRSIGELEPERTMSRTKASVHGMSALTTVLHDAPRVNTLATRIINAGNMGVLGQTG